MNTRGRKARKAMRETPLKYNEDKGLSLILVADDEPHQRSLLKRWLELDGHKVETVESAEACLEAMTQVNPSALCVDLHIPAMGGVALLKRLRTSRPDLPVIMLSADTDSDDIMTASRLGACDTLTKPVNRSELVAHARRAVAQHQLNSQRAQLKRQTSARRFPGLMGRSAPMMSMFKRLEKLAASDINVLIQGDSGTGKGLVAEAIHHHSERREGPFVVIDCATSPEDELTIELFGHPGDDGDAPRRARAFERAHQGTLFLDGLAELTLPLQTRLLRAMHEHTHKADDRRPGFRPDFRLIAATRRNLREDVELERFREDLFYQIAVFELQVPKLAERGDDVELLARHFIGHFTPDSQSIDISPDAMALFKTYHWPGNVRELQNTIQHALLICDDEHLAPEDLPPGLQRLTSRRAQTTHATTDATREALDATSAATTSPATPDAPSAVSAHGAEAQGAGRRLPAVTLEELEEMAIKEALERCESNATEAIRQLGLSRATFYRKLKKYGLK